MPTHNSESASPPCPTISGRRDPSRAEGPDEIWCGDVLLGTFEIDGDADMFWRLGRFEPTSAGKSLEPLFERMNRFVDAEPGSPERERFQAEFVSAWQAVRRMGLRFEGRRTNWFAEPIVLLVARNGRARFVPVSPRAGDAATPTTSGGWWRRAARKVRRVFSRETGR